MKNVLKNIIALVILGVVVFVFRQPLKSGYFMLQDKYFPCSRVISYSIGTFDPSFGISKDDFLSAISESENMWETSINKDLFVYDGSGKGELKINLVYDARQATTQKLKVLDQSLEKDKKSYNNLKFQIDELQKEYNQKKAILEATPITRNNISLINNTRTEINSEADKINSLVGELNTFVSSINLQAKNYNRVGGNLGEEFEEGIYRADRNGKNIDIYQKTNFYNNHLIR